MDSKQISVIIPCYNVEKYVSRCLDSILDQSIGTKSFEIICVDDKSTDGTLEILRSYEKDHPDTISLIESAENGRQGRARNIGLEAATGKWIAFIDSDDWVEQDYLERLSDCTEKYPELDVYECGYARDFSTCLTYFDEQIVRSGEQNVYPQIITAHTTDEHKRFVRNRSLTYAVYSKLIRRDFLTDNEIFFPEGLAYEDIYWGGLINMYASGVCIIEDKLYHYFVNKQATLLSAGAGYHTDMLTVQEQLWNEYIRRGLMDVYSDEIELEFVYSCALAFWKVIVLRFEEPPYNLYQLLCTFTQTHIPDIAANPYVEQGVLPEMYMLMLESLFNPLDKTHFLEFADNIKTIGI